MRKRLLLTCLVLIVSVPFLISVHFHAHMKLHGHFPMDEAGNLTCNICHLSNVTLEPANVAVLLFDQSQTEVFRVEPLSNRTVELEVSVAPRSPPVA